MSDRPDLPAPIEAIVRAVGSRTADDDERASTFARGLALGALVGAAIAGSAIWQRRLNRTAAAEPKDEPPATGETETDRAR